jgi:3',5'-cyclic AMP phosphodiesterase CpdA
VAGFRLAHLSDLHLGPLPHVRKRDLLSKRVIGYVNWRRGRSKSHRTDVVEALVTDLAAQAPDHVIVSGDLVNIALPAEFVAAGEWLRALGPPDHVTVVPGNHDAYVPLAWHKAWVHWSDYMAGDGPGPAPVNAKDAFPFLRRRGPLTVFGLSSAVASPPTFATGKLGKGQLRRLAEMLEATAAETSCRVVVVHHPPVRGLTAHRRRLVDDKALGLVLARQGADLVLCGHEHEMKLGSLPGPVLERIPVVVAPSASHGGPTRQGGYLIYTLEPAGGAWRIGFELRAFDAEGGAFQTVSRGSLRDPAAAAVVAGAATPAPP